jgi:hypothetical protein
MAGNVQILTSVPREKTEGLCYEKVPLFIHFRGYEFLGFCPIQDACVRVLFCFSAPVVRAVDFVTTVTWSAYLQQLERSSRL